jgi:hypothetical protein
MLHESNKDEEREQKQSKQGATGKKREVPSWRWHLRRDGCEK